MTTEQEAEPEVEPPPPLPAFVRKLLAMPNEPEAEPEVEPLQPPIDKKEQLDGMMHQDLRRYCSQ